MTACAPPAGGLAGQGRVGSGSGYQRATWGSRSQRASNGKCAGRNDIRATRESIGPRGLTWSSDPVKVMELGGRGLERQYLKRKAEIQSIHARLLAEPIEEVTPRTLPDLHVPIQELTPERRQ